MSYSERKVLYSKLEELRGRPLIAYVTSIRPGIKAVMAGDSIPMIIDQISKIPPSTEDIDFLIISNGGDPITSLRIISILRERFKSITVIIPYVAYSAATVLALGADEILMHPYSNLGPVDPQMTIPKQFNDGQTSNIEFGSEDIRNYIEFIRSDVGITDQAQLMTAFSALASQVGTIPIGSSKRSQQLTLSLSIKMLETHMDDKNKAALIAKALNTSYYHHGYAVGRKEAKAIGLNIVDPQKVEEEIVWRIWEDFCYEMKCTTEFNPLTEIMSDPKAKAKIESVSVIQIPANTPPQLAQRTIENLVQKNLRITQQEPLEINQLLASVESTQKVYSYNITNSIAYWRNERMEVSINCTTFSQGWKAD